ncbi:hypothetical protein AYO40_03700 [Planctomycetaceae bacterium SCGC AG-212-D15]|nr:hypothetical protein AYO40_03700 [Planctomycetaceae bacterium SCGC AG-212-D15]
MSERLGVKEQSTVNGRPAQVASDETASAPEPIPSTVIEVSSRFGWRLNVGELWRARELVFFLAWRDVKVRYKQTVLGVAWAVLQPALWLIIFTMFLGRYVAADGIGGLPYPVFVLAGIVPWLFFATAVSTASNSIVSSERFITKIYFPRLAIPTAAVGAALVDFAISVSLLAAIALYWEIMPGWNLLLAPVIFGLIVCAALGLGIWLAALNVAYRDVRHAVPFLIQVGMFATPTIYSQPAATSSRAVQALMIGNPLTALIAAFRASLTDQPLDGAAVARSAGVVLVVLVTGCLYFRRVEDQFADII